MTGYYDIVLGAIPLALVGITGAFTLVGLPLTSGVMVGAATSIGVMGHAMFVNGPVDDVEDTVVDAAPTATGADASPASAGGPEPHTAD
jgi:hypothetical protein